MTVVLQKLSHSVFIEKKKIRRKVCNTYTSTTEWSGNYSFYAIKCPQRLFKTWPGRASTCVKPVFNCYWVLVINGEQFFEFFQADLLLSIVFALPRQTVPRPMRMIITKVQDDMATVFTL